MYYGGVNFGNGFERFARNNEFQLRDCCILDRYRQDAVVLCIRAGNYPLCNFFLDRQRHRRESFSAFHKPEDDRSGNIIRNIGHNLEWFQGFISIREGIAVDEHDVAVAAEPFLEFDVQIIIKLYCNYFFGNTRKDRGKTAVTGSYLYYGIVAGNAGPFNDPVKD